MNWKEHTGLAGAHAFLSPSKTNWLSYPPDKLQDSYLNHLATVLGTRIHALADELIKLKVRLPNTTDTLNMFVNDAIGFRMRTEQTLFYSVNAFGTADAITFYENVLRIHDLKTGKIPGKMAQLDIYDALFCLDYEVSPFDISIINRIYQNGEIVEWSPKPETIRHIMDVIISHDILIQSIKG